MRRDRGRRALLIERARPGSDISELPEDEATAIAVEVGLRLWRPAVEPFRWIGDHVPRWLDQAERSEQEGHELIPLARKLYASLEVGRAILVHGDFHDPAGNIMELIAHRTIGETGAAGAFTAGELLGVSEVGLVGDPPSLAEALERELGLEVWSGVVTEEGRLAFVGEKARTLILCRAGRPWLPTGRPAEAHPVDVVLAGQPAGEVPLDGGGWVRRRATRAGDVSIVQASSSFRHVIPGG